VCNCKWRIIHSLGFALVRLVCMSLYMHTYIQTNKRTQTGALWTKPKGPRRHTYLQELFPNIHTCTYLHIHTYTSINTHTGALWTRPKGPRRHTHHQELGPKEQQQTSQPTPRLQQTQHQLQQQQHHVSLQLIEVYLRAVSRQNLPCNSCNNIMNRVQSRTNSHIIMCNRPCNSSIRSYCLSLSPSPPQYQETYICMEKTCTLRRKAKKTTMCSRVLLQMSYRLLQ
jgi:hypothetical protein